MKKKTRIVEWLEYWQTTKNIENDSTVTNKDETSRKWGHPFRTMGMDLIRWNKIEMTEKNIRK